MTCSRRTSHVLLESSRITSFALQSTGWYSIHGQFLSYLLMSESGHQPSLITLHLFRVRKINKLKARVEAIIPLQSDDGAVSSICS